MPKIEMKTGKALIGNYVRNHLSLFPALLGAAIFVLHVFITPVLEEINLWKIFIGGAMIIGILALAEGKPKSAVQRWIVGIWLLLAGLASPYCHTLSFLFITAMLLFAIVLAVEELLKLRSKARLPAVIAVIIAGCFVLYISSGIMLVHAIIAQLMPFHSSDKIDRIEFSRKNETRKITEQNEIAGLLQAWRMYYFPSDPITTRKSMPPYIPEEHQAWTCTFFFTDGSTKTFTLGNGLRQTTQSVFIGCTSSAVPGNIFMLARTYQSPELYPILQPLLWPEVRHEEH